MSSPVNPLVGNPQLAQQLAGAPSVIPPQNPPVPPNIAAPDRNIGYLRAGQSPSFQGAMAQSVLGGAQNAQANPNAPQPQAPVLNPVIAHAAKTGMGFHALMGTHGVVGDNGTVAQVPNKPGDLFRSILAGAIMGASTGAQAKMGGGIGSFAVGAGAAQQQAQQQKEKLQQQSQQQFQNQQELTKENREKQLADARLAQMTAQTARWNHENDLHDKEAHDAHNKASQALVSALTDPKVGGHDPTDGTLPGTISAADLAKKYMANPKIRFSSNPDVEQRHFIDTSDASEVQWSDGANNGKGGWVDESGDPVNMTDKTTFRVIDVPRDTQNQKIPTSGVELNALAHLPKGAKIYDNDTMYPVSVLDKKAIFQNGQDRALEQSKVDVEGRRVGASERAANQEADRQRHAEFDARRVPITAKKETLQAQLKEMQNDPTSNPADRKALMDSIAEQDQILQDLTDAEYPQTKGGKPKVTEGGSGKGKSDPIQATVDTLKGKTPQEIQAAIDDPKNGVPDAVKPEIWKRLGKTPPTKPSSLPPPVALGSAVAGALAPAAQNFQQIAGRPIL